MPELTEEQRRQIIWESTLTPDTNTQLAQLIAAGKVPKDIVQEMRRLAQTDLWYLARHVICNTWLESETHKPITDFFVAKNPDLPLEQQDDVKERLLLYPRGTLKSTLDCIDAAQWILCFPDVVIIVLTAADDLATAFVDEIRNYFTAKFEGGKVQNPTLLQALFPEFVAANTRKEKGAAGEFTTPARTRYFKEPTLLATSIEANNSGAHCHVLKIDDAISDANSETPGQLKRLTKKISMAENLITMGLGYLDLIGTRYALDDAYGKKLKTHGITELYGSHRTEEFQYLCLPAWWLDGTNYQLPDKDQLQHPELLKLLFPQKLTYRTLRKKHKDDPETFASQQLNDPSGAEGQVFLRDDLVAVTVPVMGLPSEGIIFVCWDLAYGRNRWNDFTVGAVGLIDKQGRIWILEIIRGKFQANELAFLIAKAIKDHAPASVSIEDSIGAQWLKNDIDRACSTLGVSSRCIEFIPVDHSADAKFERIKAVHPLIVGKRMLFSAGIDCLDDLYSEFERVTGKGGGHDDIPDAISQLLRYQQHLPAEQSKEEVQQAYEDLKAKELYNLIYRIGQYAEPINPEPIFIEPEIAVDEYTGLPC